MYLINQLQVTLDLSNFKGPLKNFERLRVSRERRLNNQEFSADYHGSNFIYTGSLTQYGAYQNVFIRILQLNSPDLNYC